MGLPRSPYARRALLLAAFTFAVRSTADGGGAAEAEADVLGGDAASAAGARSAAAAAAAAAADAAAPPAASPAPQPTSTLRAAAAAAVSSSASHASHASGAAGSALEADLVTIFDANLGAPRNVSRFINRELSWVAFNERVLAEAESPRHPLLERVRFLSISHSNLDEFYMVRVAGFHQLLRDQATNPSADGLSPQEQLDAMKEGCGLLQVEQQKIWTQLRETLKREAAISIVAPSALSDADRAFLRRRFLDEMWPQLTPQSVDPAHPFPFIPGKGMGLMFTLRRAAENKPDANGGGGAGGSGGGGGGAAAAAGAGGSSGARAAYESKHGKGDGVGFHDVAPVAASVSAEGDFASGRDDDNSRYRMHGSAGGSGFRNHNLREHQMRDDNLDHSPEHDLLSHDDKTKLPTEMKAILLIPPRLPRFVRLPVMASEMGWQAPALNLTGSNRASAATGGRGSDSATSIRFVLIEDVLMMFLDVFFPDFTVKERGMFRILRDSEVEVDEEAVDLVRMFEKALKRRRKGLVVDLTVDSSMPQSLIGFMSEKLGVNRDAVTIVTGLVGLADVKHLIVSDRKALQFADFEVRLPERVTRDFGGDIFAAIRAKDLIVHHPFESFETVLMFVRQAARDPNVVTIKQTLYRTSEDSPIVKELIDAAEAGKTVTALIELKARFDEEANIRWARDMERAGVHVVYGFVELKTHAKVSLAVRREEDGLRSYVHFGTGNYHPMTAKIYTDLSYFTASPALGRDANRLFNFMTGYGKPYDLELIAVAPVTLRTRLEELIRVEIANARAGLPSGIWVKVNALVDVKIINLLYEASEAGVEVDLVVRGMCALRPGVAGLSSRIRVKSVIGRFLEHSRILVFANGTRWPSPNAAVFMSSADWMTRNLDWRVEALVPLVNPTVHAQVLGEIMTQVIEDEVNSWRLGSDGEYTRVHAFRSPPTAGELEAEPDSHRYFMRVPSLSGRGKGGKDLTPRILSRQERRAAEGI